MRRRALLAALTATAGCSGLTDSDEPPPPGPQTTPESTETPSNLPYRDGSGQEIEPRGFRVHNRTDRERYVTVVVEHDGETVFVESGEVAADTEERTRTYGDLVAATGIYRVTVETSDGGRTVHDWVVASESPELTVVLGDDVVWTTQRFVCHPRCDPVSRGGDALESLPQRVDETDEDRQPYRRVTSNALLTNSGTETRTVRLAAAFQDETLVDYRYDVRPGLDVVVPLTNATGVVDLTLEVDGASEQYEWHVPEERFVFSDVADGPGANCALPQQFRDDDRRGFTLDRLVNLSTESHTVSVSVDAGDQSATERYEIAPESDRPLDVGWTATDTLTLTVELETGERVTGIWSVCPSRPRSVSVGVDPDGTLALLRWGRPILTSGPWYEDRSPSSEDGATPTQSVTSTPNGTSTSSDSPTDE